MKKLLVFLLFGTILSSAQDEMKVSLGEVVRTALENNLDIKLQKLQVDSSKIAFKLTKTNYEPSVDASAQLNSSDRAPRNSNEGDAGSKITDEQTIFNLTFSKAERYATNWQVGISANGFDTSAANSFGNYYGSSAWIGVEQKLLKGFSLDPEIRLKDEYIAKGNLELSRLDLKLTIVDILSTTEGAYWDLVNAIENQAAIENSLDLAKQLYQQNKTKIEIGTLAPIELVFAESNVASKESELVAAENRVKQAEDVLRKIMNLPDSDWDRTMRPIDSPNIDIMDVTKNEAFDAAFRYRAELDKQRINEENEQLNLKYFKNQRLPDLKLNASYSAAGSSYPFDEKNSYLEALSNALERQYPGYDLKLSLAWTPFNKFNDLKITEAELRLRQRELEVEQTRKTIREEVRGALRELKSAEKSIKANEKTRKYREESLAAEIQKFQNGLTTNYQIAEAQDQLTLAISQEIQAKISYRKALIQYYKAIGQLSDNHGIRVD